MTKTLITLEPATAADLTTFREQVQKAFAVAATAEFGVACEAAIPPDSDVVDAFDSPDTEVLHILSEGRRVGGPVVSIDSTTQQNSLDLFFVMAGIDGHGIGKEAWSAIVRTVRLSSRQGAAMS
jgi:hypothetical protein